MFGSKKNKKDEKTKDFLEQIHQQRDTFESSMDEARERRKRIHGDVCQLTKNTEELSVHAKLNTKEASEAIQGFDVLSEDILQVIEEYAQLAGKIQHQSKTATSLVESNKHFTSPAKHLAEVSKAMSVNAKAYEKQVDDAAEYGSRMVALVADVSNEAKRLGESGKDIAVIADAMQQTNVFYEKALTAMKEDAIVAQARVLELEETVARLISLMKDNNVGMTKLLKECQETVEFMNQSGMRDFSADLIPLRDRVVNMRNLDEEIAKCCERNKIQLSDIQEDIQNQRQELAEIESDLFYLLDAAEAQVCKAHRG